MVIIMSRRDFLKKVIKFSLSLIVIAFFPLYFYLRPTRFKPKKMEFFYVTAENNLPKIGVKKFNISINDKTMRIYIVKDDKKWIALWPVCTHLGCLVNWNGNVNEFRCPCHGGRYKMDGTVLAGPPRAPLTRLPMEIRGDRIFVGLRMAIDDK